MEIHFVQFTQVEIGQVSPRQMHEPFRLYSRNRNGSFSIGTIVYTSN